MKIRRKLFILAIICIWMAMSCSRFGYELPPSFTDESDIRLVASGEEVFVFDPMRSQYGCNLKRGEFRAHSDNMSDYFFINFTGRWPSEEGERCGASISWTTKNNVKSLKNVSFEVLKADGTTLWLYDSAKKTAAVIPAAARNNKVY